MKSDATRLAVVFAWWFAVMVVSGLITGSAAIAHDGKKHTGENPHVLYVTEALLMMERGEVIATDPHLNEEGPFWYLMVRPPPDYEFVRMCWHLSTVIARGSHGLALHWPILPGTSCSDRA